MFFGNSSIQFDFTERYSLRQILFEGRPLLASRSGNELFVLSFVDREGNPSRLSSADFLTVQAFSGKEVLRVIFSGHNAMPGLKAVVAVRLQDGEPLAHWHIALENISEKFILEWIDFPGISVPYDLHERGGNGKIFWPGAEGVVFDELQTRENSEYFKGRVLSYPLNGISGYYPGTCPMQFMAHWNDDAGLYFAAHDMHHLPKGVELICEGTDSVRLFYQIFCGNHVSDHFSLPFSLVTGGFRGNWENAALIYRKWMEENDKSLPEKLFTNPQIPDWLKESPVVLIYPVKGNGFDTGSISGNEYFPYSNALPTVRRYAARWNCRIMALLMHWEGTAPWAPPYVWPPFGGEEMFSEFGRALHDDGNLLGVYCSGIGWTQSSSIDTGYQRKKDFEEKHLENIMAAGPRGEMRATICNGPPGIGQRIGYEMCPACDFTIDTVCNEIRKITESQVDYIQFFDQNQGCSAPLCYNSGHGHPAAPGQWLTGAMSHLLNESMRCASKSGRPVILGCENAAAQPYIRYLPFNDLRNHLAWAFARPVPAYSMLFHEYINNFTGNGVCLAGWFDRRKSPQFLQFRMAYSFISGEVLSVTLKKHGEIQWSWVCDWEEDGPDQEILQELIGNLNDMRRGAAHDFLVFGRMQVSCPVRCNHWELHFTGRRSPISLPWVLSSNWSFEERTAQILVNCNTEKEAVRIEFPDVRRGLLICADGKKSSFCERSLKLEIPGLQPVMIEFQREEAGHDA